MVRNIYSDFVTDKELFETNIRPPRRYLNAVKELLAERAGCRLAEIRESPLPHANILKLSVVFSSSRWTGR